MALHCRDRDTRRNLAGDAPAGRWRDRSRALRGAVRGTSPAGACNCTHFHRAWRADPAHRRIGAHRTVAMAPPPWPSWADTARRDADRPSPGRSSKILDRASPTRSRAAPGCRQNQQLPERPCDQLNDLLSVACARIDCAHAMAPRRSERCGHALAVGWREPGDARRPLAERRHRRLGVRIAVGAADSTPGDAAISLSFRNGSICAKLKSNMGRDEMGSRPFTMIAALVFFAAALLHVYRVFTHFQIIIGSHEIPQWISYFGIVIPALLAILLLRENRAA